HSCLMYRSTRQNRPVDPYSAQRSKAAFARHHGHTLASTTVTHPYRDTTAEYHAHILICIRTAWHPARKSSSCVLQLAFLVELRVFRFELLQTVQELLGGYDVIFMFSKPVRHHGLGVRVPCVFLSLVQFDKLEILFAFRPFH